MRLSLLRAHPDFRRYWLARLVSYAGDQIARTALLIAVFDRHGGAALGLLLIAGTAPRLFGPALGALADRFDQRRIIVACDAAQVLVYVAIALLAPPLLLLVAAAATAFTPAGRSLLPRLVAPDRLGTANAQLAVGVNLGFAAGPALGGLLLAGAGLTTTLLLNAATFVVSATLVAGIRELARSAAAPGRPLGLILREGLTTVRGNPVVRAVATGFLVMVAFAALDNVALVPFARDDLGATATEIGLLGSLYGIGMVLGPMLIARARMHLVLYAAFAALGLGTLLTGAGPVIAFALAGQALAGTGAGWHNVAADTLIQQHVPADRLGTVFGTVYMFPYAAELIAYASGTALLTTAGARGLLLISGLGILATLTAVGPLLARALRAPAQPALPAPVAG